VRFAEIIAFAMQTQEVRWIPPPRDSIRHGMFWVNHPRLIIAGVLVAVTTLLATAMYRRYRRK
jgi:hypothetical protein